MEYVCEIDEHSKSVTVRERVQRCIDCKYCTETAPADMWHDAEYTCDVMRADVYPDGYCFLGVEHKGNERGGKMSEAESIKSLVVVCATVLAGIMLDLFNLQNGICKEESFENIKGAFENIKRLNDAFVPEVE